jgi:hypothetical protein
MRISFYNLSLEIGIIMQSCPEIIHTASDLAEEKNFVEFRRKIRSAEVLSGALEHLLRVIQFTGRVSVVVQNGRVLKSGYEEGYFRPLRN